MTSRAIARRQTRRPASRRGFTVLELLTVFFIILVLAGVLLPALSGAFSAGRQTESISRLRGIGEWSVLYTDANNNRILPSQFDDRASAGDGFTGNVRKDGYTYGVGEPLRGTWTDILWVENELAKFNTVDSSGAAISDAGGILAQAYYYDSPDSNFFAGMDDLVNFDPNDAVLRSTAANSKNAPEPVGSLPTPFGEGALADGDPGYFAANDFFNAASDDPDPRTKRGFWGADMIRQPSASLYAIDSFHGETIAPTPEAFDTLDPSEAQGGGTGGGGGGQVTTSGLVLGTPQVDFRYRGTALALLLDGSVKSVGDYGSLGALERGLRGTPAMRVRNLADQLGSGS